MALLAAALVHVTLLLVLLTYSNERIARVAPAAREIVLSFQPLPKPSRQQPASSREAGHHVTPRSGTAQATPDYRGITLPDTPVTPELRQSLFGCTDAERRALSDDQRTHCANAFAHDDSVDIRDGTSRSRDAALWERGRQRKNAPVLLPCMNPQGAPNPLAVAACLAQAALDGGFHPDQQPSYADTPEINHLPNNGDPPDKPTYLH